MQFLELHARLLPSAMLRTLSAFSFPLDASLAFSFAHHVFSEEVIKGGNMRNLKIIVALVLCSACSVKVSATRRSAPTTAVDGIPFYRPMPYLAVKAPILLHVKDTERGQPATRPAATSFVPPGQVKTPGPKAPAPPPPGGEAEDPGVSADKNPEPPEKPAIPEGAVEVVYLPDFCESYALNLDATNAKLEGLDFTFTNGWMLAGFKATLDSSAGIAAVADIAKSIAENAAKTLVAALGKSSESDEPEDEAQSLRIQREQAATAHVIEETYLQPGIYSLFERPGGGCDELPRFVRDWKPNTFTRTRTTSSGSLEAVKALGNPFDEKK